MKNSTDSIMNSNNRIPLAAFLLLLIIASLSLFIGRYPLSLSALLSGDALQWRVFWNLRFSRVLLGIAGGYVLGVCGVVFQTVFHNPLASPDIIGVSSGAGAGAAAGILFFSSSLATTVSAFAGAFLCVLLVLMVSSLDRSGHKSSIILSGIAIHAFAQMVLMALKLTADPERELAAIEYWLMGGLNNAMLKSLPIPLLVCLICTVGLFLLHRQTLLLSAEDEEAQMLGVSLFKIRLLILVLATLAVSSIISLTGLISFVGLLAPHIARALTKKEKVSLLHVSGLIGAILLCVSDIFARTVSSSELPVSLFTSFLGAPFLIWMIRRRAAHE